MVLPCIVYPNTVKVTHLCLDYLVDCTWVHLDYQYAYLNYLITPEISWINLLELPNCTLLVHILWFDDL